VFVFDLLLFCFVLFFYHAKLLWLNQICYYTIFIFKGHFVIHSLIPHSWDFYTIWQRQIPICNFLSTINYIGICFVLSIMLVSFLSPFSLDVSLAVCVLMIQLLQVFIPFAYGVIVSILKGHFWILASSFYGMVH